ncbi:MAG: translation initiation factor IF-2 subunit gamma [Candidatus Micrarchaeota archaeon]|nr:MAG: translation initiation factor IF-2 subunit gamma [Candidatus Micrarchaeota archaeon]
MNSISKQGVITIGTLGHVDHGKTTLTKALTGVWTDKFSESIKRNMTIKLGYADVAIRRCPVCEEPRCYSINERCKYCGSKTEEVRRISIIDSPGHETLMATAIAASNIIDAVLFVIAANEPCPMPQTREHAMVVNMLGIKNIIIVQTKVDIVGKEAAKNHYKQIKEFVKGTVMENAPIVPVVSTQDLNIDYLLKLILEIKVPDRKLDDDPLMYVARSFDINKPGTKISDLKGGVIGGSIIQGKFKVNDIIEIKPGVKIKLKGEHEDYHTITTRIKSIYAFNDRLDEAIAGGLVAFATEIDPFFTKSDSLVGSVVGLKGRAPDAIKSCTLSYHNLNRPDIPKRGFIENEQLVLIVGTATTVGVVTKVKKDKITVNLSKPVVILKSSKIAVFRRDNNRWRLTGYATLSD